LAKEFNGEMVSADSRQVYRGMDIGTGKDLPLNAKYRTLNTEYADYRIGYYEIKGVRLWLYDVVGPDYKFSVADYAKCASVVIRDIWKRGKLPIVAGGTGFYIKVLVEGIGTAGAEPDWKLRRKLQSFKVAELQGILEKTCAERLRGMNESDRKNPRRLMRAIEIARQNQKPCLAGRQGKTKNQKHKLEIKKLLTIGLTSSYETLYGRIDKRVEERVRQAIVEEIEGLLGKGYTWENSALGTTIGYKEWEEHLNSLNTKYQIQNTRSIIQRWKYDEHAYARRQMTWFRKSLRGVQGYWFDITGEGWENKVTNLVAKWHDTKG